MFGKEYTLQLPYVSGIDRLSDSLEHLDLQHNVIQSLSERTFAGFRKLQYLNLAHNRLKSLSSSLFDRSRELQVILLPHNGLSEIGKATFADAARLQTVDLSHNSVNFIDEGAFGADNVETLRLADNQLDEVPRRALNSIANSLKVQPRRR